MKITLKLVVFIYLGIVEKLLPINRMQHNNPQCIKKKKNVIVNNFLSVQ